MAITRLPKRLKRNSERCRNARSFPAHRQWVRGHACCVPGCESRDIECAHVRPGTDGGLGLKPADFWCLSLCRVHHAEQHRVGEAAFAERFGLDLQQIAGRFAVESPHRGLWREIQGN